MLSNEDRKQIIAELVKELRKKDPSLGMSTREKQEFEKQKQRELRKSYLEDLKKERKENLAQQIESLKLAFEDSKWGKRFNIANKVVSPFTSSVAALGSATVNSKLSKNIASAAMYSNPITALIADNMDLVKGIGGAGLKLGKGLGNLAFQGASGLYSLLRKKKPGTGLATIENGLPSAAGNILNAKNSKANYIIVQKATFTGGKNYVVNAGGFNLAKSNQKLIEAKDNNSPTSLISKGVVGIASSMKNISKIVNLIKTKQIIMAGAVLLGVAAIIAILNKFKNPFNDPVEKLRREQKGGAVVHGQQAGELESTMAYYDALPKLKKQIEQDTGKVGSAGVSRTESYKKGDVINKQYKHWEPTAFNKTTFGETDKPYIITCPMDAADVQNIRIITKDKSVYYEVTLTNTFNKALTSGGEDMILIFHYMSQCYVYKGQNITKYYPIGISSPLFYISSKGSKAQAAAKDFEKFTNEQAVNNYNHSRDIMGKLSDKEMTNYRKYWEGKGYDYAHPLNPFTKTDEVINSNTYVTRQEEANKNVTTSVNNAQNKTAPSTSNLNKSNTTDREKLSMVGSSNKGITPGFNYAISANNSFNSGVVGQEITA